MTRFPQKVLAATAQLQLRGIHKRYGEVPALDGIDLHIRRGEVFGIIGRSGAGKSTLLRLINRLETPSAGQVLVDGKDIATLGTNGLRQLRPQSTRAILALLRDINQRLGLTIVLITHEMEVIRDLCDRVAVLERGSVVEQGEVWQVFGAPQHAVSRLLLASHEQPGQAKEQTPGHAQLELHFTGVKGVESDLGLLADTLGSQLRLLEGSIERIQGRALGKLRLAVTVGAPAPDLLQRARAIADWAQWVD